MTLVDWNGNLYQIPKRPFALCRCGAVAPTSRFATARIRAVELQPPAESAHPDLKLLAACRRQTVSPRVRRPAHRLFSDRSLAGFTAFLGSLRDPAAAAAARCGVFDASHFAVSLTVTAPTIAVALAAPFVGRLADLVGRKRVIVGSAFAAGGGDGARGDRRPASTVDRLALLQGLVTPGHLRHHHRLHSRANGRRPQPDARPPRTSAARSSADSAAGRWSALVAADRQLAGGVRRTRRVRTSSPPRCWRCACRPKHARAAARPRGHGRSIATTAVAIASCSPPTRSASACCSRRSRCSPT